MMENFLKYFKLPLPQLLLLSVFFTQSKSLLAQDSVQQRDSAAFRQIYTQSLTDGRAYDWLKHLTQGIGHRLSGSPSAEKAVFWTRSVLDTLGFDSVWLQPVIVPHWVRGTAEKVAILPGKTVKSMNLHALALGGSVGTPPGGIQGQVVRVSSWEALDLLGEKGLKGKIAYFNRAMDQSKINTFEAYGGAVDQRVRGASKAARYGAIAVIVRSVGTTLDTFPHTGVLHYDTAFTAIPAIAISTRDAEMLNELLNRPEPVRVSINLHCESLPDAPSHNVIASLRGTEQPNDVILVGGHLDSWDVGQGAHDDGAGVVQSMEVLRLLHKMGYRPRHTIRCVLFMNEENGGRGGAKYAEESAKKGEFPLASIESDAGGFSPRSFGFDAEQSVFDAFFDQIKLAAPLFKPYGIVLEKGGGGADIGPLKGQKGLLGGLEPDSQRYFDLHHTGNDVFEQVNKRELQLGAAAMAALVYWMDQHLPCSKK